MLVPPVSFRHALAGLAAGLAVLATTVAAPQPEARADLIVGTTPAAALVPDRGLLFGAYVDTGASPARPALPDRQSALEQLETRIGRKLDLHRVFLRWDDGVAQAVSADLARQRTPILSIRPRRRDGTVLRWAAIAAGGHDGEIIAQARAVAALDVPIFLSFHHEPDDASAEYGTPAEFVDAWRHYVWVFRHLGVRNVAWTWIMTPASFRPSSKGVLANAYYPGDDVVNWLGVDAYNWFGCGPGKPDAWRPLADAIAPFRSWSLPHRKPLMLPEWGSSGDPADPDRKAQWLREAWSTLTGWPEFKAVAYFHGQGTCPWWADSSETTLRAFAEIASSEAAHSRSTALLGVTQKQGPAPLRVSFNGSRSAGKGSRAGSGIAAWRLDFGDGSAAKSGSGAPPSGLPHVYRAGTFTATLTVYPASGGSVVDRRTITSVGPPIVTADAKDASDRSAVLHAWVNPRGLAADVTFEWATAGGHARRSGRLHVPAQGWAAHLQLPLTGLTPATRYYWRVMATSAAGAGGVSGRWVDTSGPPTVSAAVATRVARSRAILNARVHPHSRGTAAWFEWSTTSSRRALRRTRAARLPAATSPRTVAVTVTGLARRTTYAYRVVAANGSGTRASDWRTVRTSG